MGIAVLFIESDTWGVGPFRITARRAGKYVTIASGFETPDEAMAYLECLRSTLAGE